MPSFTWLGPHFFLCALSAAILTAPVSRATALDSEPVFTTVVVQPLASPRPVAGADDRVHLAYELAFVNETRLLAQIDDVAVLDAGSGAVLGEWRGDALAAIFRINGNEPGVTLARSHSG